MNKILILGQARSGSTYFKNNLNLHEECFFLNEPLAQGITDINSDWPRNISSRPHCGLDGEKGMGLISDKEWIDIIKLLEVNNDQYFNKLWNTILRNNKGKYKNFGMKFFWNHNNRFSERRFIDTQKGDLEGNWWLDKDSLNLVTKHFNKFIILNRPIEETIFSRIKSMTTNMWGTRIRNRTKNTYPTFKEYMTGLYNWSEGKIATEGRDDHIIEATIRYHVGAEEFCRYMKVKYNGLDVEYNNINWEEISDYLGMKVEDKVGYNKFEYDLERWFRENPEFKHIFEETRDRIFHRQKKSTF